jgi:hypothetical protein
MHLSFSMILFVEHTTFGLAIPQFLTDRIE